MRVILTLLITCLSAIETIRANVAKLRDLSPLWEMYQDGVDLSTIQWTAH